MDDMLFKLSMEPQKLFINAQVPVRVVSSPPPFKF